MSIISKYLRYRYLSMARVADPDSIGSVHPDPDPNPDPDPGGQK